MTSDDTRFKIRNCKDQTKRARYWTFEIYPDSCNSDYVSILRNSGIKCCISPLHCDELFIEGDKKGQLKKDHNHGLIAFNYGARLTDFDYILDEIKAYKYVEIVKDCEAMFEYLIHKNDQDKKQYAEQDITYINSNKYDYVASEFKEVINYIKDYDVKSFKSLVDKLLKDEQDKLLLYCSKNTYYIKTYIDDKKHGDDMTVQGLLATIIDICDNIDVNNPIDTYAEIKNIKRLCTDPR